MIPSIKIYYLNKQLYKTLDCKKQKQKSNAATSSEGLIILIQFKILLKSIPHENKSNNIIYNYKLNYELVQL